MVNNDFFDLSIRFVWTCFYSVFKCYTLFLACKYMDFCAHVQIFFKKNALLRKRRPFNCFVTLRPSGSGICLFPEAHLRKKRLFAAPLFQAKTNQTPFFSSNSGRKTKNQKLPFSSGENPLTRFKNRPFHRGIRIVKKKPGLFRLTLKVGFRERFSFHPVTTFSARRTTLCRQPTTLFF